MWRFKGNWGKREEFHNLVPRATQRVAFSLPEHVNLWQFLFLIAQTNWITQYACPWRQWDREGPSARKIWKLCRRAICHFRFHFTFLNLHLHSPFYICQDAQRCWKENQSYVRQVFHSLNSPRFENPRRRPNRKTSISIDTKTTQNTPASQASHDMNNWK